MNEKISIIVPVYNAEKTLKRCVAALFAQTYHNIQIILVNDGSKDSSLQLCREYEAQDKRVLVIDKPNGGVSYARNAGLDAADGEYIMFCDSDDWVEPEWCEELISHYEPHCLVMCGFYCIEPDGHKTEKNNSDGISIISRDNYFCTKLIGGFAPWNKLYSRDVIEMNNIRFPLGITLGEDKLFVWRYLQHITGEIICIGRCLNNYIWPLNNSLTTNLPENYYKQCDAIYYEIKHDIEQGYSCTETALNAFYNDCYLQYERALKRVFQSDNISKVEQIRTANQIMRSEAYQTSAHNAAISTNKFASWLCKKKNCLGILLLQFLKRY